MTPEQLEAAGIYQNTIRLSLGTEHIDDILWDLEQGFQAVSALN
jgi:O-acetylhomoserine (thiol)-lyase